MAQKQSQKPLSIPSYLYRKNGIFYYRFRLPKSLAQVLPKKEIRISLRTGSKREAQAMARRVYIRHMDLITESQEKKLTPEEQFEFIKTKITNYINNLLKEPNKKGISETTVRHRIKKYIQSELDRDNIQNDPLPQMSYRDPTGKETPVDLAELFEKEAAQLLSRLNTGENAEEWFEPTLFELAVNEVFRREEITRENCMGLVRAYLKSKITINKIKAARIRGDFRYEQPFFDPEYAIMPKNVPERQQSAETTTEQTHLTSEVIELFCKDRLASNYWKPHMEIEHRGRLINMIDVLGDQPIEKIGREDFRYIRDTLLKLPPSRKKNSKYKGKSIQEILSMKFEKTLSIKTVNEIMIAISSMMEWCVNERILKENYAKDLLIKDTRPDIEKKEAFTIEDINKLFFDGNYNKNTFKHEAYYWGPLISLYTGMRREEIAQLHCKDIYKEDGLWIIDINQNDSEDDNSKHLKTENAIRKIPIHNKLIELGFIDYVEKQKKRAEIRLFSGLNKTTRIEIFGKQLGNTFNRFVKQKGIIGKKSFHSLRHTFADFYKQRSLQNDIFEYIFGHRSNKLATNTYGSRIPVSVCYREIISKLDYSMEAWEKLRKIEKGQISTN